ncbi:MAG: glycosyl transferase 4, partial [Acetatifactor sp.]|nr:glycosyl transferase 4 [Acetatifactor sp.]
MRVLWVCNIMLPVIAQALQRECSNKEGWLTGLMDALIKDNSQVELGVAFPIALGEELLKGSTQGIHYYGFRENTIKPEVYDPALEQDMQEILQDFQPDLLHCFGTEYPHTLAAVRAYNRPDRTLIGIQGLCAVYADAYMLALIHIS